MTFISKTTLLAYGRLLLACKLGLVSLVMILFAQVARAEGTITIVAFGDSLTHGYGLPTEDGFVPQLQSWLTDNGGEGVTLINAGLSGDTTAGGLARIDWTLSGEVDAVIVALGGNDMLRGIFPELSRENLDGILAAISKRGLPILLVGIPGPSNYGAEFKAEFDGMYSEMSAKYETLFYPSFFEGFGAEGDASAMTELMQADATHPNAEGVRTIVNHMGPTVLELVEQVQR